MNNEQAEQVIHLHWPRHEFINVLTHFIGFLFALGGVPVLLTVASLNGSAAEVATFSVYSASLIILYLASTLYHGAPPGRLKEVLQSVDHMAVYLLIAGTYTPFLLARLGGGLGWSLFTLLWALAAIGIGLKIFYTNRYDLVSTIAYVLMGWVGMVAIVPLYRALPGTSFAFVLVGGIAYTVGTIFYRWESLPHNHGIWHVFCLVGSACHFVAVFHLL